VRAALTGEDSAERRTALGIGPASTIVLLSTEGADANPAIVSDSDHLEARS
jgi:diaminopropionate ammonia-lyase